MPTRTSAFCTPASRRNSRSRPISRRSPHRSRRLPGAASNNLCYCLAVEKLLRLEIPPQAQWMRVMLTELTRLNSHLVWLGTHAHRHRRDERVPLLLPRARRHPAIFEMFSGQRMMTSYFRIGGLALEPPRGWHEARREVHRRLPEPRRRVRRPATNNPHLDAAARKGVGFMSLEDMLDLGVTGPMLRAAGLKMGHPQGRAVLELREVRFRSADAHRERRLRAVPGARRRDAAERAHRQAGAGRHAGRAVARPTRRTWCCPTAKR